MRVFVTGGTGFVGGHLVRRLLERGDSVVALARHPDKAALLANLGAQVLQGDITDPDSMRPAMRGAEAVFHMAGWYKIGNRQRESAYVINVQGTRNVLELMAELSIPKGVYTSTLAINSDTRGAVVDESYRFQGEHLSLYDETKAAAHHQVATQWIERGLPLVIVLPGVIYGPGDTSFSGDTIRSYLSGSLPTLPRRAGATWGHVDDIVEGHLLALDRGIPGESYIIAGPCHTYVEVFEIAQEICGVPAPSLRLPVWMMRLAATLAGALDRLLPLPAAYTAEALRIAAGATYYGTNAKARQHLGYEPRSLMEGFHQALPHYQAELEGQQPADSRD